MAAKNRHTLHIQIKDQRGTFRRLLRPGDKLSVGKSPHNDIVVFDDHYPKSSTLIECKGDTCRLYIHPKMKGGVRYQESTLAFQDLIVQDILPQKDGWYVLSFAPGRKGLVEIGDTKVGFMFDGKPADDAHLPSYTWGMAIRKAVTRDLLFKFLLLIFIGLEVWWGMHLSTIEIPPLEPPEAAVVPKRFARFMLKEETPPPVETVAIGNGGRSSSSDGDAEQNQESSSSQQESSSNRNKPVTSVGLLGLIGGTGESNDASKAADFLLDQGLAKELDELLESNKTLRVGRSSGHGSNGSGSGDGLDGLLDVGLAGGIDDLVADDAGVETVQLKKKGDVNIQAPKSFRGAEEAKGQRSAESVAAVVKSQQARVMYTYNKYLRQDPNLRGKVSLDVTIAADGRISNVRVTESTIDNANFIRDLINIIRQLRFPPISEGNVTVSLPFVFNRVN